MHYFSIVFKKFNNHSLIFCAFGGKTQIVGKFWETFENIWWRFYRKIAFVFYFNFGKCVIKIEHSEIKPFFYNIFSVSGGGSPFPLATPLNRSKFPFRENISRVCAFFLFLHINLKRETRLCISNSYNSLYFSSYESLRREHTKYFELFHFA